MVAQELRRPRTTRQQDSVRLHVTIFSRNPGVRENGMYLAYLRDLAGNKICALCVPS